MLLTLWLAVTARVWAEPRRAELTLEADPACIRDAELRGRAAPSDWELALAPAPAAQLFLAASVRRDASGALAVQLRVTRRDGDGRSAERVLAAGSCEAALDALALLVQMTLDAEPPPPAATVVTPEPGRRDASGVPRVEWLVGASVGVASGPQPGMAPALGLFAALRLRGVGWFQPSAHLELSHSWRSGVVAAGGTVDFALDGGQLWLCPVGGRWAGFAADGCGAFELARLRARGYDTYAPRTAVRPWASAGAGLLVRALLLPRLALQLGAAALAPLWRDELSFAPEVFYAVPAWRWQLKVGVALRFP